MTEGDRFCCQVDIHFNTIVMDELYWQCSRSLTECIRYMYSNKINCDVTFFIGEHRLEIQAHKFLLMSRSPVFYAMFSGPLSESDKVAIPDIDKDVFEIFLTYLYTDTVYIDEDIVTSVLYAANKYCVDGLAKKCTDFLEEQISLENVCGILNIAELYHDSQLRDRVMDYVCKSSTELFSSDYFLDICPKCMTTISSLNELTVDEVTLFESVLKWADKECSRQSLEVNDSNRKLVLTDILKNINFFMLPETYLTENVLGRELFSDQQKEQHLQRKSEKSSEIEELVFLCNKEEKHFSKASNRLCYEVLRFAGTDVEECCYGGEQHAIEFETSCDMRLHGIIVYGTDCYQSCDYDVTVEIEDNEESCLHREITWLETSVHTQHYKLYFKKPIPIRADTRYTISLTMYDFETKSGYEGKQAVCLNDAKIRFFNSVKSSYCTDINKGQIPGLLLS